MKRFARLRSASHGALVGVVALVSFLCMYFAATMVVGPAGTRERLETAGALVSMGAYALPATLVAGAALGLLAARIRRARLAVLLVASFLAFPVVIVATMLLLQASLAHAVTFAWAMVVLFTPLAAPGLVAAAALLERWTRLPSAAV